MVSGRQDSRAPRCCSVCLYSCDSYRSLGGRVGRWVEERGREAKESSEFLGKGR